MLEGSTVGSEGSSPLGASGRGAEQAHSYPTGASNPGLARGMAALTCHCARRDSWLDVERVGTEWKGPRA